MEDRLRGYLGLRYRLVGVQLAKTTTKQVERGKPLAYCHMLRLAASEGRTTHADRDDQLCPSADTILGFTEPADPDNGHRVKPASTKALVVAPLAGFLEPPEVVHAILTPRQAMEFAALVSAVRGAPLRAEFIGRAACGEFTAMPYQTGEANISMLCNGARALYSEFKDNEFILGAPSVLFADLSDKVGQLMKRGSSLCGCRTCDFPPQLVSAAEKIGFTRSVDYFMGHIEGVQIRFFLNKDLDGRPSLLTVQVPVRMKTEEEAKKASQAAQGLLVAPYSVVQRGPWLDIVMTSGLEAVGVDPMSGSGLEQVLAQTARRVAEMLPKLAKEDSIRGISTVIGT